jgi:hypothetical protein
MTDILSLQELPSLQALGIGALGVIDDGGSCTICSWTCEWTTCLCTSMEAA